MTEPIQHQHVTSEKALDVGIQVAESSDSDHAEKIVTCEDCRNTIESALNDTLLSDFKDANDVKAYLYTLGKELILSKVESGEFDLNNPHAIKERLESIAKSMEEIKNIMPDSALENMESIFKYPCAVAFLSKIAQQIFLNALLRQGIAKVIGDEFFLNQFTHLTKMIEEK